MRKKVYDLVLQFQATSKKVYANVIDEGGGYVLSGLVSREEAKKLLECSDNEELLALCNTFGLKSRMR